MTSCVHYCKHLQQISHTFFPKIGLEIGGAAYLQEHYFEKGGLQCPVFHLHIQSNTWLLLVSYERSAHFLVVMQKSMEKLCGMKKFLSTNTKKDQSYVKVGRNDVHYNKVLKLWVRL